MVWNSVTGGREDEGRTLFAGQEVDARSFETMALKVDLRALQIPPPISPAVNATAQEWMTMISVSLLISKGDTNS
jgi:hypothetical protein